MPIARVRPSEAVRYAYQLLCAAFSGAPITLPQAAVLRALLANGPLKQGDIVIRTNIDRSTLSDMLRRMAMNGLVVSVRVESDKRSIMVSLTPAGRAALLRNDGALADAEMAMMRLVPAVDRAAFLRGLRGILEAM